MLGLGAPIGLRPYCTNWTDGVRFMIFGGLICKSKLTLVHASAFYQQNVLLINKKGMQY